MFGLQIPISFLTSDEIQGIMKMIYLRSNGTAEEWHVCEQIRVAG